MQNLGPGEISMRVVDVDGILLRSDVMNLAGESLGAILASILALVRGRPSGTTVLPISRALFRLLVGLIPEPPSPPQAQQLLGKHCGAHAQF